MLSIPRIPTEKWCPMTYDRYVMTVNGQDCQICDCRVSAIPFNRVWPGKNHQREINQTELAGFARFFADEPVQVQVTANVDFKRAVVRPLGKEIDVAVEGRMVSFQLSEPGGYVLELDGVAHALHIFFAEPRPEGEQLRATRVFGPGVHFPGCIKVENHEKIYVHPEAVVYGGFYGEGIEDLEIFGGGILDGGWEERVFEHCYEPFTKSTVKFYGSRNIHIDGLTILNSACWTINAFGCADLLLENINIVGQWRYNTDGIDLVNTQRAIIRNCFVRSFDDTIVLKGIIKFFDFPCQRTGDNVEDILVENCTLWCDWGRTCEIGIETSAPEFKNIEFRNCDLIHNASSALDIQNGCEAVVKNIVFRDIRVEMQADQLPSIYQHSDDMPYEPKGQMGVPHLIYSANRSFFNSYPQFSSDSITRGITKDILYENITVFAEEGVPKPKILVASIYDSAPFGKHTIRNLVVNGKRITDWKDLQLERQGQVENIILE